MQLAEALYHLKSVGLDNTQAMMALKTASDLAAVGGANLEQTTNAIAAAWRSGIKGAQNFTQAAATVNAIIGAGNMKMQDFVSAMGTGILSAANTFGVSLKQVGGAMALMTDEGVPAQMAATRLRMSLSLLGAPSQTAAKQLATIGLSSTSLAEALRSGGLTGAIGLLKQHIQETGLSAVQTSQLLSRAFGGGQSSSAILTMINNYDTLKKKQDQINAGMSKYGADVAAQQQTIQAQLDILRSTLETTGVRMGQALLPPFTKLVKFLASDLLPAALRLGGVLGRLFKNPLVDAFAGSLLAAAVAIRTIIGLTKMWNTVQELLDVALTANPVGIVIVAVAALAAGIAILYARSETFRKIVSTAFRAVRVAAEDVWNWIKGHWMLLAAILLAPFAPVIAAGYLLYKLVGIVAHVFDEIKNVITGGFDSWWAGHGKELEQVWDAAWGAIRDTFNILFGPVIAAVKAGWNLIVGVIKPGMDLLETIFRAGWGWISATTRGTWDLITGIFKAAWDVISGIVQIAVSGVESVIKIAWDLIVGIFDVALDLLTGHWSKAWDDIQNTVTQVWNAIKGFLGSAISDIESMFAGAWNALLGGVKSWGSDLIGYVKQIPGMILSRPRRRRPHAVERRRLHHQGADRRYQVHGRRDRPRDRLHSLDHQVVPAVLPGQAGPAVREGRPVLLWPVDRQEARAGHHRVDTRPEIRGVRQRRPDQLGAIQGRHRGEVRHVTDLQPDLQHEQAPVAPLQGGSVDPEADRRPREGIPDRGQGVRRRAESAGGRDQGAGETPLLPGDAGQADRERDLDPQKEHDPAEGRG